MRKNRKLNIKKIIILVLVLLLFLLFIFYNSFISKINSNFNDCGIKAQENIDINKFPVSIMLLGEGTNVEDGEKGVDSISLLLINPKNKIVRLIGIPRDSYLPTIDKNGNISEYDKITNSGENINNLKKILEETFKININYFASINFLSFINIIDILGGIEMEVPDLREGFLAWKGEKDDGSYIPDNSPLKDGKRWCEHDSKRNPYAVCFDKFGKQILDGEHALALSRTRHYDSDFARNNRQMEMIKAIGKKMISNFDVVKIINIIEKISNNLKTNISADKFLDFIFLSKKIFDENNSFAIETLQLDGESDMFDGEKNGYGSYNKVSLYSLNLLRHKCQEILDKKEFILDSKPFYFDVEKREFESRYKFYNEPHFLSSDIDIRKEINNYV